MSRRDELPGLPPDRSRRGQARSLSGLVAVGSFWTLVGRFGHTAIMLLGTPVLARLLTPADFGLVAVTSSLCVLMLLICEGLIDVPIVRLNDLSETLLRTLLWSGIAAALLATLSLLLLSGQLERAFDFDGLAMAALAVSPIFFAQAVMVAGRALYRRNHRFREAGWIVVSGALAYVAVAIVCALAGLGFWSLIAGQLAAALVTAARFAWGARLSLRPPSRFALAEAAPIARDGFLSRVLAWYWSSIDTLAIGMAASESATGLYSRAYNLSTQAKEPFAALDHPIRQSLVAARERESDLHEIGTRMLRLVTLATSTVAATVFLLRERIVDILLGGQWAAAALPLGILVLALPARIALAFIDSMIIVAGRTRHMVARHLMMSVAMSIGLLIYVDDGIVAVAVLVCLLLYAMVMVVGAGRTAPVALARALLPGLTFGTLLAVGGETLRFAIDAPALLVDLALGVAIAMLSVLVFLALPTGWTWGALDTYRTRLARTLGLSRRQGKSG